MLASVENRWVVAFGWTVLALVFLDELLAMAAFGVWGWSASPRWLLVWLLPLLAMLAWFLFASPKARYGGPLVRPVVKVLVFGLASLALWDAGHPDRRARPAGLLGRSVNALAMIPAIRDLPQIALTTVSNPPRRAG